MSISVVYWSGTGNTQAMAEAVAEGIRSAGADSVVMEVSDAALHKIAEAGFDPLFGARPLKRAIQNQIENPLSKYILEGKFGPKDVILVDEKNGELVFDKRKGD